MTLSFTSPFFFVKKKIECTKSPKSAWCLQTNPAGLALANVPVPPAAHSLLWQGAAGYFPVSDAPAISVASLGTHLGGNWGLLRRSLLTAPIRT